MANMEELRKKLAEEAVEDKRKIEAMPPEFGIAIVKPTLVYFQSIPDSQLRYGSMVICSVMPTTFEEPKIINYGQFCRDYGRLPVEALTNPSSLVEGQTALGGFSTLGKLIEELQEMKNQEGDIPVYFRDISWGEQARYLKGVDDRMIRTARAVLKGGPR